MPRARLGLALLLDAPVCDEIQGLRRALGDGSLHRIPPHLTLVPPVNVAESRIEEALDVVRQATAVMRPFRLVLGPPGTFLPENPVLFLAVGGEVSAVHALREQVLREPLARPAAWPFIPHVTLADDAPPEVIHAGLAALACYEIELTFDRVHVLREGDGRVWRPVSDVPFGEPAVIGRGGLPLELTVSHRLDAVPGGGRPFAITARRDGEVVGIAAGRVTDGVAELSDLTVAGGHRHQGVGGHLLAAVESLSAGEGCHSLTLRAEGGSICETFLRSRGWEETARQQVVTLGRRL